MALFTTTDRDNIKTALVTAAVNGVASVSVGGQEVQTYSLEQLKSLLAMVLDDLSSDDVSHGGLRLRQLKPGGCG